MQSLPKFIKAISNSISSFIKNISGANIYYPYDHYHYENYDSDEHKEKLKNRR